MPPERFCATAHDWSAQGHGLVNHPDGRVVFVPGLWPGETAQIELLEWHSRYGQGRLVEIEQPHPARIAPACPHHGTGPASCTGCSWQEFEYEAQCAAKQERLTKLLADFAPSIAPILPAPTLWGYRTRAQLKTDGDQIGYVNQYSGALAPIEDCPVLSDRNRRTLSELRGRLPVAIWRGERLTTLDIDEGVHVDTVSVNMRRSFHQANSQQNKVMGQWLKNILGQGHWRHALELFCGDGNFTRLIAGAGIKEIVALDSGGAAIAELRGRHLRGVTAHICDLTQVDQMRMRLGPHWGRSQLLVLDPPRAGYRDLPMLIRQLPRLTDIVYISCDPYSFSRDTRDLNAVGFRPETIQPLDMFPHTPHVEILSWFRRSSAEG